MAERGNDVHRRVLSGIAKLGKRMQRWIEMLVDGPGSSPPPPSLTETPDPYRSDSDDEDDEPDLFVKDPTTSGRIYTHNATTVIYRFTASLEDCEDELHSPPPLFEFQQLGGYGSRNRHMCTVMLPPGAPIRNVSGPPLPTQSAARRAACLQTCKELFYKGYLDYKLFPRPPPVTVRQQRESYVSPAMVEEVSDNEDDEDITSFPVGKHKGTGARCYPRRKPDFWANTTGIMQGCLYPTIISTERQSDSPHLYQPLLLLTRLPLPSIESFKLFFSGVPSNVHFRPGAPFQVGEERLQLLHKFTMRLCRAIINKPFVCRLEALAYFIAPLGSTQGLDLGSTGVRWELPNVEEHIPWHLISLAVTDWVVPLKRESLESLTADIQDAVIQDRWVEFTRRYVAVTIRPDLDPLSKPADSPVSSSSFVEHAALDKFCAARS